MSLAIDLSGKRILVTGGASGIGAACCQLASEAGASVVVADRDLEQSRQIARVCGGEPHHLDVTDAEWVESTIDALEVAGRPLDALIHSAGILQNPLSPEMLSLDEWDRVIAVNLRGAYVVARAIGKRMSDRGQGSIVLVASIAGIQSGPLHSYGPAKAGVISLAASLAAEWGHCGVRVNAVSPGFTSTPALKRGIAREVMSDKAMRRSSALGRLLEPEEVAGAALFLSSRLASGITGINLPVDAGYLAATGWGAYGGLRSS